MRFCPKKIPSNLSEIQSIILMESLLEGDGHTDKTGFSRNRSIVTDGFSLREWEDLVFKKKT